MQIGLSMQKFAKRIVAVNDRGGAIGEDHPRAVLTNHEVELMLELRSEGYSYAWLAEKFEVAKSTVFGICTGKTRVQHAAAFRTHKRSPR